MVLVVTNDGRTRMLGSTALLAIELVSEDPWAVEPSRRSIG